MAWEEITKGGFMKSNSMAVGEAVEGFLLGVFPGKFEDSIEVHLQKKDGDLLRIAPHGTLRYLQEKIEKKEVVLNALTKIQRSEDYTTKKGRVAPSFRVFQDKEVTLEKVSESVQKAQKEAKDLVDKVFGSENNEEKIKELKKKSGSRSS